MEMSYEIKLSTCGNFLRVQAEGKISTDLVRKWAKELEQMRQSTGIRRFLFDLRNARNISRARRIYDFAYEDAAEFSLNKVAQSAILVSPGDTSHDFAVVTLRNVGFKIELFNEELAAIKWLTEG